MTATLEHLNITVSDPQKTARWLCDVFGWRIRWEGASLHDGYSMHVGGDDDYIAIYTGKSGKPGTASTFERIGGLNHIGVVVPDLDAVEAKVKAQGFVPNSHQDYEPGRRFYFDDHDGIEYEVVMYN